MNSIETLLNPGEVAEDVVWVEVPTGFVALPLEDIGDRMANAETVVGELAPDELREVVGPLVGVLSEFLRDLVARRVVYCGIGRHLSALDSSVLTSSLVVSLQAFPEERNPRLVLKDLVRAKADAGERAQVDLVHVDDRPMLFAERVVDLPTPRFPGQPDVPPDSLTSVFQLEALVPSEDGTRLVGIEFSTPFAAHGPEFRTMVVTMAASVSFTEPAAPPSDTVSAIGQALDG
jgi:hypothetical protein